MNMVILATKNVDKHFGALKAVDNVSISIERKSITSLIGPNGSGKTTLFNVISGFYPADGGTVLLNDENITGLRPHEIARKGLVRTFQIVKIFRNMTVIENMLVGPLRKYGDSFLKCFLKYKDSMKEESDAYDKALYLLDLLQISHLKDEYASNLSGGQMKLLCIGIALMRDPEILLLDEPVAGVNPTLAMKIFDKIISLRDEIGKTFFIVEHNMDVVLSFSDKIYVMNKGQIIAEGNATEIVENRNVIDAYLGVT
jgi:branched-chain amino acid transport system ATP-binding protein